MVKSNIQVTIATYTSHINKDFARYVLYHTEMRLYNIKIKTFSHHN